jgi:DNA polymerase-3 subunit delta'
MAPYPWQMTMWARLQAERAHLPHALLLYGKSGTGKLDFARQLAQSLLCQSPAADGLPCRQCQACTWFEQQGHPDFRLVSPTAGIEPKTDEEGGDRKPAKVSKYIVIDQIRELTDFVSLTSHQAGLRIVAIAPAERMNAAAANALLKTLEEPPPNTLLLLVADQPGRLPATILSRCRKELLPAPGRDASLRWLKEQAVADAPLWLALANDAPLAARDLAQREEVALRRSLLEQLAKPGQMDPLALAEKLEKTDRALVVGWLQQWIYDLISSKLTGQIRFQVDVPEAVAALAGRVRLMPLLAYQRELIALQQTLEHPLNSLLLIEQLLFSYQQAVQPE